MLRSAIRTIEPGVDTTRTLLVVEDEELVRDLLTEFLTDAGYRVLEAANVAEAKAVVLAEPPVDLVFSDINMPGREDGFALAKWLRQQYPTVKVLLTSGVPHVIDHSWDLTEPLMAKPYNFSFLVRRIQTMLSTTENVAQ